VLVVWLVFSEAVVSALCLVASIALAVALPLPCRAGADVSVCRCGIDEETAARIAREIMGGDTSNPHLAEERGQEVDDSGVSSWLSGGLQCQAAAAAADDPNSSSRMEGPVIGIVYLSQQVHNDPAAVVWCRLLAAAAMTAAAVCFPVAPGLLGWWLSQALLPTTFNILLVFCCVVCCAVCCAVPCCAVGRGGQVLRCDP
jgi:hypothetical protein